MTEGYKNTILNNIETLDAFGGTNIYSGLEKGLQLIENNYSSLSKLANVLYSPFAIFCGKCNPLREL
jgi:hypothetical protein